MINLTTLENGVRIITEHVPHVESAAIGFWIATGARDESSDRYGFAHFTEHMLFKGTKTRSARDIADEVASVGGQMNAGTDREYTTYYMKVLKEFVPLGLDVLSDMLMNSTFDKDEIKREKDVICEEIRRHEDMPEDRVHDLLTEITWEDHRLGHSVIGSEASVRSATRESLVAHRDEQYTADRLVVSAAGNLDHNHIVDLVSKELSELRPSSQDRGDEPAVHQPARRVLDKDTEAVYFCLGAPGYSEMDDRKFALSVMDAVLGAGMSSRLFQEIREKRGLAYDIGSYRVSYHEGGMFAVYGGTGVGTLREVLGLVSEEFARIREQEVPEAEFRRAQTQIRGAMLLAHESMGNRMGRMGKSLLDYGRFVTMDELIGKMQAVTPADVARTADELLREDHLSRAIIGPADEVEKVLSS